MESQSQDFQIVNNNNNNFFSGFQTAPLLAKKQNKLRAQVFENSALQTKQTSLSQKINQIKSHSHVKQENSETQMKDESIAKISVIVQSAENRKKSAKKVKKQQKTIKQQQKPKYNKSFEDLRLIRPLLKVISQVQYTRPTPVQQLAIPTILSGRDVVASSVTGSGKTAAFLLPILQRYYNAAAVGYIRALIVTPTRQLALQIYEQFSKLNKYTNLQAALVIGASSIQKQEMALRNNPQLVIGTPGRIIDVLMNSRSVGMQDLQMIIFDEADKLLELGFQAEIKQIMQMVNTEAQSILFSATMGQQINKLSSQTTRKPLRISADPDNKTAEKLHQQVIKLKQDSDEYRQSVLLSVLLNLYKEKVIVFFKTKKECHRMAIILGLMNLKACQLHGNLSQTQRLQAFINFKQNKFNYLMATDLAARGLDIKQVQTVINYELPTQLTRYIHRIGRTARAGNVGTSLTLCNDEECLELKKMSKKTGDRLFKVNLDDHAVKKHRQMIQGLQGDIQRILMEERQERDIRKAEMELKKLENINDHQGQIYSRPKKQWFISQKQKKRIQQKAKVQAGITIDKKEERTNNRGRFGQNKPGNKRFGGNNKMNGNKKNRSMTGRNAPKQKKIRKQ